MDIFILMRIILKVILFFGVGINFFYQVIRAYKHLIENNYSANTTHRFKCWECQESYDINGAALKSRTSIWSLKMEKRTPRGRTVAIKFECPQCQHKAFQEKIYDIDLTAGLGNIRAQLDESGREILGELFFRGVLPVFVLIPLLNWF